MADRVMTMRAYGLKLLGSGGLRLLLMALCSPEVKKDTKEFKEDIFGVQV